MVTRKDVASIVARSIASVNVTSTSAPIGTLTAPLAGTMADTFGGTLSGDFVLKLLVSAAVSGLAATSVMAWVAATVYVRFIASGCAGVSVTVRSASLNAYVVVTGPLAAFRLNDVAVTVARATASEKRTTMCEDGSTSMAPAAGETERTVGGTTSCTETTRLVVA